MQAIRMHQTGGPEVLALETLPDPAPAPGEVLIDVEAVGVNFIDCYHRSGLYPQPLPFTPGVEGTGTVCALGTGVTDWQIGDRVAWAGVPGSYAERIVVPTDRLVPIPATLTAEQAAAALLQGLTARVLTTETCPLAPGDSVLIHAGAGGMGRLLIQLARARGARVITTVGHADKIPLARAAGAERVIDRRQEDVLTACRDWTAGKGVRAVFDGIGAATFDTSLAALSRRGMLVLFGQASGPVPPVDPARLAAGSLFLTRPSLFHYIAEPTALRAHAAAVFAALAAGELQLLIHQTLPLSDAAAAHRALESGLTAGKLLLIP
ncbi:MAG: quinone oxidoreductase [Pseudomonadota bacterium]|nr:quinone oxidoreductase [Pseudomonadota bacterium]